MAEKSDLIDDIVGDVEPFLTTSISSGISDFSSAFNAVEENQQIPIKEKSVQLEESKDIDSKRSRKNTQDKSIIPIIEKQ